MTSVWHDGQLVVRDLRQITPEERKALQALVGDKVAKAVRDFWTDPESAQKAAQNEQQPPEKD